MIDTTLDGGRRNICPAVRRGLLLLLAVVTLGACGLLPSEPPKFEETYVVQAASLNLSAIDLAPGEIGVNTDSSAFEIVSDSTIFVAKLGDMCTACRPINGTTAAKPAFTYTFSSTIPVSPALISASITGGAFDLYVAHTLSFDPIRPSATARGSVVMTVKRGTTTVASLTLDGNTQPLPADGLLHGASVPMTPFNLNGPLTIDVTVTSPAGNAVTIDTSDVILVFAGPVRAQVSQVTVSVASQSFADTVPLDLTQTKLNLNEKLEGGAFRFNFTNPFAVGGSFTLKVLDAGGAILLNKNVTLAQSATSANRLALTKAEITSLLGKPLTVIISGTFSSPTGQLVLTPKQVANFTTLLEIIVRPLGG